MRVLIAIDDPLLDSLLERQLHALGLEVDVSDAQTVSTTPDFSDTYGAVFLGGTTLEASHFDLARTITRQRADGLPIVVLTSRKPASDEELDLGELARVDGWLEPPLSSQRVASAITEAEERMAKRERQRAQSGNAALREEVGRALAGLPPDVAARVVRSFSSDTQEMVAEIRLAAGRSDLARLRFVSHKIAGASGTLGFRTLSALCRRIEYSSDAEAVSVACSLADEIEAAFHFTRSVLDETAFQ